VARRTNEWRSSREAVESVFLARTILSAGVSSAPLARPCAFGYHSCAMLSRAQEARVRDVLANHPPGTIQAYCLEHLAAAVKIPPGHLADRRCSFGACGSTGACQTCYGGICDADAHETDRVLIWGPPTPVAVRGKRETAGGLPS
jgi:hypothetical protein